MKKHFWTILLVLCMALCLIPTPAVYASDFNGWTKLTDEYSGKNWKVVIIIWTVM